MAAEGASETYESAQAAENWVQCARESQKCSFSGTRQVRYGNASKFYVRTLTGGTDCSNAIFGDPAVAQEKWCWYAEDVSASAPTASTSASSTTSTWRDCANESQFCSFAGTQQVRYGTAATYVTRALTDGVSCSNAVFGDPAKAQAKWCRYEVTAAATTPAPTPTPTPAPAPAVESGSSSGATVTWTECAKEGGTCSFSGTRDVRYGTNTAYVTRSITGGASCTNVVFGDPAVGSSKYCRYASSSSAATTPDPVETPSAGGAATVASGSNAPIIFNASRRARAGDIVSLQGANFGTSPKVTLVETGEVLSLVNRVGESWVAFRMPDSARGAMTVKVSNATGTSASYSFAKARPAHLDTLQVVSGGAFRVFGQNLLIGSYTPVVRVDGKTATVDRTASDENMLVVRAPTGLAATRSAAITVDNGTGAGAQTLDRTIEVVNVPGSDPFGLSVGWAGGFADLARRVVLADSDSRLSSKVVCDGRQDISRGLQAAVNLAASSGGGIVRLPSGTCRLAAMVGMKSSVVIEGAGKGSTQLRYEANYPFFGQGVDLAGVRQLSLISAGAASEGLLLKDSTRVFLQNISVDMGTSRQMFFSGNRNMVVSGSDFVQRGSIALQGPYTMSGASGLSFVGNSTTFVNGASSFGRVHDAYIQGNRFTRNASNQTHEGTVHSMTIDFAYRVAVVGNSFGVTGGPIWNKTRNDGETILTEGGGNFRTESLGAVTQASSSTVADSSNRIDTDPFDEGAIPENFGVAIVAGKGAGQTRRVTAYSGSTMTVQPAWEVVPDSTSRYATFVWGLEKSLIKGNKLSQNPRGVWLYHTAIRDVDVTDNEFSEGGGIYLRSFQSLAQKRFMPIYNVRIAGNKVGNSTGQWSSYVNAVFVNSDARAFGIANLGIEIRDNQITSNLPNVSSAYEEYVGTEGFMGMMRVENYDRYEAMTTPRQIGTVFQRNRCSNCDVAFRIGTGAGGTVLYDNPQGNARTLYDDWATTKSKDKSSDTVVR